MPAFAIPLIIQGGEALVIAIGAAFVAHQAGMPWDQAIGAGVAAAIGKILPSQMLGKKA